MPPSTSGAWNSPASPPIAYASASTTGQQVRELELQRSVGHLVDGRASRSRPSAPVANGPTRGLHRRANRRARSSAPVFVYDPPSRSIRTCCDACAVFHAVIARIAATPIAAYTCAGASRRGPSAGAKARRDEHEHRDPCRRRRSGTRARGGTNRSPPGPDRPSRSASTPAAAAEGDEAQPARRSGAVESSGPAASSRPTPRWPRGSSADSSASAATHPPARSSRRLVVHDRARVIRRSRSPAAELDVSIILPVYNEVEHLEQEVDRVRAAMDASEYSYEIIVVDDGSSDGSGELALTHPRRARHPLPAEPRLGFGAQGRHRRGARPGHGVDRRRHDVPERHDPAARERARRLRPGRRRAHHRRGHDEGLARARPSGSSASSRASSPSTKIPDLNSGFRAFRTDVARQYLRHLPPGFSCVTTMTMTFLSGGYSVKYIPIEYAQARRRSRSSTRSRTRGATASRSCA